MSEIEQAIGNGVVKSNKPKKLFFVRLIKGITTGILIAGIAIGSALLFTGCKNQTNAPPEQPKIEQPVAPTPDTPTPDVKFETTFQEFTSTYKEDATNFAKDVFNAVSISSRTTLGYSFETNADGKISAVILNSVIIGENNERSIMAEKITLTTPISIDDIIEKNYTASTIGGNYTQVEIFKFNAKENYVKEDLAASLFSACGLTGGQAYFTEAESTDPDTKIYEVAHIQNGVTTIYKIEVDTAETEEEVIQNIQDTDKRIVTTKTQLNTGSQVEVEKYEQEEFQPESVEDLTENYSSYVHSALNEHFYPTITKTLFGRTFDANKLIQPEWRIVTNDDNQITGFKFIAKYNYSNATEQYYIGNITLEEPIALTDFTEENASTVLATVAQNATYTNEFGFGYLKAEQGQHDALMNAIFKANGMGETAPEGAERYFVDNGSTVDTTIGEARSFKLLQIEEGKTTYFTIIIKETSSDSAYIELLKNESNYILSSNEFTETQGQKIDYKAISPVAELDSWEVRVL